MLEKQRKLFLTNFGKKIKRLRQDRNITQEQLASKTGFHAKYISDVERGLANPTLVSLKIFSDAFEVELPELISDIANSNLDEY